MGFSLPFGFLPSGAVAVAPSVIIGSFPNPSQSVENYTLVTGRAWYVAADNQFNYVQKVSAPGKFKLLKIMFLTAPGDNKGWTIGLRVNGVNTALAATVTGSALPPLEAEDATNEVTVARGDLVSIFCTPFGSPTGSANGPFWCLEFEPDVAGETLLLNNGNTVSPTANYYHPLHGYGGSALATIFYSSQIIPTPGTLKFLVAELQDALGGTKSVKFTLWVNGVATALTCTISGTATTGSDLVHEVAVVAGDIVTVETDPTGSPAYTNFAMGLCFVPVVAGESIHMNCNAIALKGFAALYGRFSGNPYTGGFSSIENTSILSIAPACTISKLYVETLATPQGGRTLAITVRKELADTAVTCSIVPPATKSNDTTHEVEANDFDRVCIKFSFTGSSTALGIPRWSCVIVKG